VPDFALLALAVTLYAVWKMRPSLGALLDAWRISRHPDHLGVLRRSDHYERHHP
jgi:hypothetical protein